MVELRKIEEKRSPTLKNFSIVPPKIPSLPEEWPSDSIWGLSDLEVLAVTLREDVEDYLAFYWDIVAKEKGTYKQSKDNIVAPFFPPLSKDPSSLEFFNKRYLAAHEAYLRKALSDQIFDGVKSKLLPLQAGAYHSTPPESACARLQHQLLSYHKVEEPEPDMPFGYQEVRQ